MNDWYEGYVSDHSYENLYFAELAPGFLRCVLLLCGMDLPERKSDEPMRYLELGYGLGLSLNIHGAADQESEFWGTDFLPEQAAHAREISQRAQLGTHPLQYSFSELSEKIQGGELPAFDMIVMHGIWSWINDENRRHILNIIHNSLKPGGVVYVSYNAMPGRFLFTPIRELMSIYAERKGAGKNSITRVTEAARFVRKLSNAQPAFLTSNPKLIPELQNILKRPPAYLAHEYLNQSWTSFYFAETARDMASIGCNYVSSTRYLQSFALFQPKGTADFLDSISHPVAKEALRDFNLNTAFRSDIYVKGNDRLSADENAVRLNNSFFSLRMPLDQIQVLEVNLAKVNVSLEMEVFSPILEVLAENGY